MTLDIDSHIPVSPHSSRTSAFSASLNTVHISEALRRSSDDGATLMFSKMNLTDVGVLAVEELATMGRATPDDESLVKRITLGNNRLTTLPTEFALLSRLRYLNLKHNSFSVFPDVLTLMPSLDILDVSYNKIKRFPTQAGHLIQLRVFCLSRNKLTRLPTYLTQFCNLEVLQVDRNPIEWPPKPVVEYEHDSETGRPMKDWISSLQVWMENHTSSMKARDNPILNEQRDPDNYLGDSYDNAWKFPIQDNIEFKVPHMRSVSVDSNISMSSITESLQEFQPPSSTYEAERPPPLHLGILRSYNSEVSPTRSLESYLPSPVDTFHDDSILSGSNHSDSHHHTRNLSYAEELSNVNPSELPEKKSMPDLRTAKLNFSRKVTTPPHTDSTANTLTEDKYHDEFSLSSPIPYRQEAGSSFGSTAQLSRFHPNNTNQPSPTRSVPSMAVERNSYFRRLSTLPLSSSLPPPLLCLIDSARSILFALCQVYQTLEHYILYAIDDRLSSVLKKVLDPATTDMMQLINSLDRFDAMSRKTTPPPAICRGVVESCRDTVAVFGKAIGVLGLQLKVIATGGDVRYSRWILLELYAASAEIASAWRAMVPNIENIKPFFRTKTFTTPSPMTNGESPETSVVPMPQVPGLAESSLSLRPHPVSSGPASGGGRVRTARRHAGSFSSKDVEIGKKLPSYDNIPGTFGGVVSGIALHTPTLRAPKRQATLPLSASASFINLTSSASTPASVPHTAATENFRNHHSRQGSQISLQTSTSSSPSIPSKTTFLDLPSNSKTQVDNEAVQAVQAAVEVAPKVWDMMEDLLGDVLDTKHTIRETLESARAVTTRLSQTIRTIQSTETVGDRKLLREDAHLFLKTVVQLSNIIKIYGGPRTVSSSLRTNMVKLTNSTEEFAILLHVSSFSTAAPRSHPPIFNVSAPSSSPLTLDENRLGASLSRSRNTQPSEIFRSPPHDTLQSALPAQTFKIPMSKRPRGQEALVDTADPG
ncbi:RAM signaling pathway protein-domain-containing protein [Collybia nuda]|uniref:RAM signaling pathway protein-domain-containing protein n=1 Tax=Collybia nuda TaxID=64659 RepID=A0A9P5XVG1_9AGAR|nr:RAM signaling pathway protein-domain-containing protein [Collybia nuda]